MYQGKTLNFSLIPQPRGQAGNVPVTLADGAAAADHESRIAALEAQVASLLSDLSDAQATITDHETRIAALEP